MTPLTGLLEAIKKECEVLELLHATVENESQAIRTRDSDTIEKLAREKHELIQALEQHSTTRAHLQSAATSNWQSDVEISAQWSQLKSLATQVKQRNAENGLVIKASNNFVQRALDVLMNSSREDATYTATGRKTHLSNHRYSTNA